MRDKKSNSGPSFTFMHLALILLCVVLVTARSTGGLFASYRTAAGDSDSARVAKFQVTSGFSDTSSFNISLNFFDPYALSDEIGISVSSQSEVSISYEIIVTMPDAPTYEWLNITVDGRAPSSVAGNVFTFNMDNQFTPNSDEEFSHIINFTIKDAFHGAPPTDMTDILNDTVRVTVHAEQIDQEGWTYENK